MFAGPLGRSTFTPPKSSFDSPLYGLVSLRRSHLVTNAVVTWNTVYMEAALAQLRTEGVLAGDLDLSHLSPALYGHLNPSPSDDP